MNYAPSKTTPIGKQLGEAPAQHVEGESQASPLASMVFFFLLPRYLVVCSPVVWDLTPFQTTQIEKVAPNVQTSPKHRLRLNVDPGTPKFLDGQQLTHPVISMPLADGAGVQKDPLLRFHGAQGT